MSKNNYGWYSGQALLAFVAIYFWFFLIIFWQNEPTGTNQDHQAGKINHHKGKIRRTTSEVHQWRVHLWCPLPHPKTHWKGKELTPYGGSITLSHSYWNQQGPHAERTVNTVLGSHNPGNEVENHWPMPECISWWIQRPQPETQNRRIW